MALKAMRFLSLWLAALACGMASFHGWEALHTTHLSGDAFLAIHQVVLQERWEVAGLLQGGALLSTGLLLFMMPRNGPSFGLTILGFLCLAAMMVVSVGWITPITVHVNSWRPETLPLNWTEFRDHWILFQGVRAALAALGLSALILALLVDMPSGTRAARISLSARSLDRL